MMLNDTYTMTHYKKRCILASGVSEAVVLMNLFSPLIVSKSHSHNFSQDDFDNFLITIFHSVPLISYELCDFTKVLKFHCEFVSFL